MYSKIHFVSDLRQIGCFLRVTPISPTNKTDRHDITEILLKVSLDTITLKLMKIRCLLEPLISFGDTLTSNIIPYRVTPWFLFLTYKSATSLLNRQLSKRSTCPENPQIQLTSNFNYIKNESEMLET